MQLLLQSSVDFKDTVQLLFPCAEEDHIILQSCLTAFYQSYGSCHYNNRKTLSAKYLENCLS